MKPDEIVMATKASATDAEILIRHIDCEFADGLVGLVLGSGGQFDRRALPLSVAARLHNCLGIALNQARVASVTALAARSENEGGTS